jgi:hypothetical protein
MVSPYGGPQRDPLEALGRKASADGFGALERANEQLRGEAS